MPCSDNGRIPDSELVSINGGRLREDAARGWKAPGGPEDAGLYPSGVELASYRDLAGQEKTWAIYQAGGNLAAYPGTSEHGCGRAIDLAAMWMRQWIDEHGRNFGWAKTEAFSEWWHVNFIGGKFPPIFKELRKGQRNRRVKKYARRLAYIHRRKSAGGHAYLKHPRRKFTTEMRRAVIHFQRDHGLTDDGVIGPKTAGLITAVFRKQWRARGGLK